MKLSQFKTLIREEVKKVLREGLMSDIDILAKESGSRAEFISKLKPWLKRNAADAGMANDPGAVKYFADMYFKTK